MKKENSYLKLLAIVVSSILLIFTVLLFMLLNTSKAEKNIISIHKDRVIPLKQLSHVTYIYSNVILSTLPKNLNYPISNDSTSNILKNAIVESEKTWKEYLSTYITPDERKLIKGKI